MPGGSSAVFRIDLADGSAVVLKTYDELRGKGPAKEAYATGLLAGLGLPVTQYLLLDESRTRLPFRFALTNHLPGVTAGSLKGQPGIVDIYRQMGSLLRRLHDVRMPAYGQIGAEGIVAPVATNAAFIRRMTDDTFPQFRRYGADAALAEKLERIVDARFDLAAYSTGAVYAHDDLHPNNVLVGRDAAGHLQLTGLIDFGNARAADSVFDLAKTMFISRHEAPESPDAILAGYGTVDHPDPAAALWFYTLIHRVVMWTWLRYVGVIADGQHDPLIDDLEAMADDPAGS